MADALQSELVADRDIYKDNKEFVDGADVFTAAKKVAEDALIVAYPADPSFSQEKLDAKTAIAIKVSILCGLAYVKLKKLHQNTLANTLHIKQADYLYLSDVEFATLVFAMQKILQENLGLIDIPSINAEKLAELVKLTEAFKALKGTSLKVHENSPTLTKAFEDSLEPLQDSVDDLKLLAGDFYESNLDFYKRIMASSAIPTVHVHHTYVIITATMKSSGKPAVGILFSFEKAKKSATTDRDGVASMEEVSFGPDVLIGTLDGKEVLYKKVKIKRSTTNNWEVVIDSL